MRSWSIFAASVVLAPSASAEWTAATPAVSEAAREPRIAAVLAHVNRLDRALVDDDRATFAAMLADDLVVNNPQNGVSLPGETARRGAGGQIGYAAYDRTIDYAGLRGDMVVLMGEERCVPRAPHPMAGQVVRRRFTDLWRHENGGWRLAVRQATIIPPTP